MAEIRTDLTLQYKSKGYSEVNQQVSKLAESASHANEKQAKGYSMVGNEVGRLKERLKDLAEEQADLNRQLEMIGDKASPAYKKLANQFKEVQSEGSRVERVIRSMERAFKDQTKSMEDMQKRGAFLQGFMQGAVPGAAFMQRGPGMGRQAIGMAVGRAARGVAGGLASTPFSGAQGIASALREIPFAGGLLAAPFQQATGYGEQALQMQRQRVQALPMLNVAGMPGQYQRTLSRMMTQRAPEMERNVAQFRAGLMQRPPTKPLSEGTPMYSYTPGKGYAPTAEAMQEPPGLAEAVAGERQRQREAVERDAARAVRQRMFRGIRGAGKELLGVGEPEALQRVAGMTQAAGGTIDQLRQQGMLRTGMAAEAVYGVQAGTSGAFARGGRLGAFAGAQPGIQGAGAKALTDQIAAAMEMGLSGSDVPMYLQQIASGITQWEQTGIPVADKAMAGFGKAVAEYGFAGPRAAAIGGGFVRAAQGLSTRGPQSAADLLMLQTMGGFKGGGAADFEKAQIRLEQLKLGEVGPEQIKGLVGRMLQAGGGGAAGRLLARQQLGRMGINVGAEEMQLLGTQMTSGSLTEAQQKRLKVLGAQRKEAAMGAPKTPEEIQKTAAKAMDTFGANLQKAAKIQNQQIDIGTKMIPMLNSLENTSGMLSKKFANLAGEPLEKLTASLERLTDALVNEDKSLLTALKEILGI